MSTSQETTIRALRANLARLVGALDSDIKIAGGIPALSQPTLDALGHAANLLRRVP